MTEPIPYGDLASCDLVVEQLYAGGSAGNAGDDPLAVMLPVGNQGGFRPAGSVAKGLKLVVLYSSGTDPDWPDLLDPITGTFTYFGDNKRPGHELHDTPRGGNQILRRTFASAQGGALERAAVPPFLLFERAGRTGRVVRFRGLMVPGAPTTQPDEQLVAIWRSREGQRFQNYRAIFTVLDVAKVPRSWLTNVLAGKPEVGAPPAWTSWVAAGSYLPMLAPPTLLHRSKADQLPTAVHDWELLSTLWQYFSQAPVAFESCAAELFRMSAPAVGQINVTRPSRDGGRDAIGRYALGPAADPVHIDFALEAKCYNPRTNSVGVRETSRLVSRIRHRHFGVMVTTAHVDKQAYTELREDGHPIVILSGRDLIEILKARGISSHHQLGTWLHEKFPLPPTGQDV